MKAALSATVLLALAGLLVGCAPRYHGYYYPPADYHHYHRLGCRHVVECHYYDGRHHYRDHHRHFRYYHQHALPGGHYTSCYVEHGRHHYRH
ncbi:MAG: hypothetical protein ACE5JI_12235 [Acidobacteriota bacterium]